MVFYLLPGRCRSIHFELFTYTVLYLSLFPFLSFLFFLFSLSDLAFATGCLAASAWHLSLLCVYDRKTGMSMTWFLFWTTFLSSLALALLNPLRSLGSIDIVFDQEKRGLKEYTVHPLVAFKLFAALPVLNMHLIYPVNIRMMKQLMTTLLLYMYDCAIRLMCFVCQMPPDSAFYASFSDYLNDGMPYRAF